MLLIRKLVLLLFLEANLAHPMIPAPQGRHIPAHLPQHRPAFLRALLLQITRQHHITRAQPQGQLLRQLQPRQFLLAAGKLLKHLPRLQLQQPIPKTALPPLREILLRNRLAIEVLL